MYKERQFRFELWDGQVADSVMIDGCIDTWNNKTEKDKELTKKHIQECVNKVLEKADEWKKRGL